MVSKLSASARLLAADMVCHAQSGHLGTSLGMADCLTVLFKEHLVFDPQHPSWFNRDRFIMSGGHGSSLLYSLLYLCGYEGISLQSLKEFRKPNSRATGHPEYCVQNGIEMTTGPLGQGLASSVGFALAERILNNRLGNDCVNHFTYVSAGDGDLMEGVAHEACSLAGNLGLGKLIVLFDDNNITIDGDTSITLSEDIQKRFEAYGWQYLKVDGHNHKEISSAISAAKSCTDKPSLIACKTKIGFGSCFEGTCKAHTGIMSAEQLQEFRAKISNQQNSFEIDSQALKAWREVGARNRSICENWIKENKNVLEDIEKSVADSMQQVLRTIKKEFFINRPFSSTRSISGYVIDKLCTASKFIISGSCDLGKSTCCQSENMTPIKRGDFSGNYVNYGIREHAMGAVINGLILHGGLKAFGGTFFAFSDYMRPSIRLSALMNIPSIFLFTHDSIGVGEDGPTHQPVEQLAGFRSMPNINVFRPGDPLETLECWQAALESESPSIIVLTRQEVKPVRFCGRDNLCAKGAYMLYEDMTQSDKHVTIFSTGSELGLASEVRNILAKHFSISADLISMPCWNLFEQRPDNYKKRLLRPTSLNVAIEAACDFGWHKYIGPDGLFFGVNNFGYSCTSSDNFNHFGLNSEKIVKKILDKLQENSHENRNQRIWEDREINSQRMVNGEL